MPYINQNRGDVRCGAFAAAYWVWDNAGGNMPLNNVNAEEEVHNIYNNVRFNLGDMHIIQNNNIMAPAMADVMRGCSNPFRISDYLNNHYGFNTQVISADANFRLLLNQLNPNIHLNNLNVIPDLAPGECAILIMGQYKANGQPNPQHYVYAVGNDAITLQNNRIGMTIIDPSYGERTNVGYNLSAWVDSFHGMQFLNTVIR